MTTPRPVEAGTGAIPWWSVVVATFLVLIGVIYIAANSTGTNEDLVGPAPSAPASEDPNETAMALIEGAGCQSCHGPDLDGLGAFPSLHGVAEGPVSENLQQLGQQYPDTWANLWIAGTGPEVAGLDRGGMPQFGETLTEEEIATIVTYLKTL